MSPRRLCFVTTFYPPYNFGGDGLTVQRLARGLARRGHDVSVVHEADAFLALAPDRVPAPAASDPFGVKVITLRSRVPMINTLLTQQTGRPIVNAQRLRRLLDDGRFDAILFNNVSLVGGAGILTYGRAAAKVYIAHEHWLVCPTHILWRHRRERCDARACFSCQLRYGRPPQWWRHTGLLERSLDHVDIFVALSEFSRAKHREFGFNRPMEIMPPCVPDPLTAADTVGPSPHPRPYFLIVGRLERIKGVEDAIAAFDRFTGADLLIVGDGGHELALRRLAEGNPRVYFVGRVESHELDRYYRHAEALVMPSVCFETFGITIVEAFSHGTPVIARKLGPMPELVEAAAGGLLFESIDELAAQLAALHASPAHRATLGTSARRAFMAHWAEGPVIDRCLDIIDRAAASRAARARTEIAH